MKLFLTIGLAGVMFATPVLADNATEGLRVAKITFSSIDGNGDGVVNQGDMDEFGESVFLGMDYDSNDRVSFEEFSDWDIGFEEAAELEGRPDAIITARRILFGMWDGNGDGELTKSEHRRAGMLDFNRADVDDNGILDEREFLLGYSVNIVMRGAIRPDVDVNAQ
ncbi:MAG: hypothetical protein AAF940_08515 [Pseudomonadota bacterium]